MQNVDSDILVIGAGGCGLMAALVAAKKGARVLLLEKTDKPGGGTAFSSKGIRAAASRRQRELKIDDDAALYAQDILRWNNGESDAVLTQRLAETSARVADFLTDDAGIEFQIGEFAFGHSAQRSHSWKEDKTVTDFLFAVGGARKENSSALLHAGARARAGRRRRGGGSKNKGRHAHGAKDYFGVRRIRSERWVQQKGNRRGREQKGSNRRGQVRCWSGRTEGVKSAVGRTEEVKS